MTHLLWLAVAGGLGALARFGLAGVTQRAFGGDWPVGTLLVNALGCFVFGLVWMLTDGRTQWSGETRIVLLTGFVGAFTTFSTFSFETAVLLREAQYLGAVGNLLAQNGLGLLAVMLGIALGRLW